MSGGVQLLCAYFSMEGIVLFLPLSEQLDTVFFALWVRVCVCVRVHVCVSQPSLCQ